MTWTTRMLVDEEGNDRGWRSEITDDNSKEVAFIEWFFLDGPFYLWCVDPKDMNFIKRVGPLTTFTGAQRRVDDILSGAWTFETRGAPE